MIAAVAIASIAGMTVAAQGQTGDNPSTAVIIDNQPHRIQAHGSMWFRFDYDATRLSTVTIQLINGTNSGMRFDVWTPDAIANMGQNDPIGHGAAFAAICGGESPAVSGCLTKNLIWAGDFWMSGSFKVHVINDTASPVDAVLTIEGDGLSLSSSAANPSPLPPAVIENRDDPGSANPIDNQQHILAAGAATWYRIEYDAADRPVDTILLVNGNHSGVRFEVWTPDRLSSWWENQPVGRGTVSAVDCDTGEESVTGECESTYLKWAGKFVQSWTFYVRVVNGNGYPTNFTLTLN